MAATTLICVPVLTRAGEHITLDRAIEDALRHNQGVTAARAQADEADARVTAARAAFFPRISFVESWQRGNPPVFVFSSLLSARRFEAENFALTSLNRPDPVGFFHGMLAAEQRLFDGGRARAGVQAASAGRDMAVAARDEFESALLVRVTDTYGRILRAESDRRAAEAAIAAAEEDAARAERRRDAGLATDADVLSLVVHLGDVRQRAIQAAGSAAVATAELNQLLGAAVLREVVVEEPPPFLEDAPGDIAARVREAEVSRPELKRAEAAVAVAEAASLQARAEWWPQVVAHGAYQFDGTRIDERASAWVVGGELRWTWSTGGAHLAATRGASHALRRAAAERDEARAAVHVEVVTAVRMLETALASERVARSSVEQARESERIIRNRFDAGIASVPDVLRASAASLEAEARRAAAVVNRLHARAALDRASGRAPALAR